MSSIKEERDDMYGAIRYIKFSGDYDNFDDWKEKTKAIDRHTDILKYLTKYWEIINKEYAEDDPDKLNIYKGNSKAWDLLIISLTYITFGLAIHCNENANEARKALIDKYDVSDDKQEIINEVTYRWKNCRIKETSQEPYTWFNGPFNFNFKFKKIKAKY